MLAVFAEATKRCVSANKILSVNQVKVPLIKEGNILGVTFIKNK